MYLKDANMSKAEQRLFKMVVKLTEKVEFIYYTFFCELYAQLMDVKLSNFLINENGHQPP